MSVHDILRKILVWMGNDVSRPPIPLKTELVDFQNQFSKIDLSKPIGVFVFNVEHFDEAETLVVNASRSSFIQEMRKSYGDNLIVIDNPTDAHLKQFSDQFNLVIGKNNPAVHFVLNHHQGAYDDRISGQRIVNGDKKIADFLTSIEASSKRAIILSCGPDSSQYKLSGFDYVAIPRPNGQLLMVGPNWDGTVSPMYKWLIKEMYTHSDPQKMHEILNKNNLGNSWEYMRDVIANVAHDASNLRIPRAYLPPIVQSEKLLVNTR